MKKFHILSVLSQTFYYFSCFSCYLLSFSLLFQCSFIIPNICFAINKIVTIHIPHSAAIAPSASLPVKKSPAGLFPSCRGTLKPYRSHNFYFFRLHLSVNQSNVRSMLRSMRSHTARLPLRWPIFVQVPA